MQLASVSKLLTRTAWADKGSRFTKSFEQESSVAGTEDGRQRRSELFPSDVAFGATDHPASGCRAAG